MLEKLRPMSLFQVTIKVVENVVVSKKNDFHPLIKISPEMTDQILTLAHTCPHTLGCI